MTLSSVIPKQRSESKNNFRSPVCYTKNAQLFGVFFILTFLSYGLGSSWFEFAFTADKVFEYVHQAPHYLVLAGVLMAIFHTAFNLALPILMLPVLKKNTPLLAYGYLSFSVSATVILVIGVIFMLLIIPFSASVVSAGTMLEPQTILAASLLHKAGFYSYQIGMAIWGLGGLLLCGALLNRSAKVSLVPVWLSVWGVVGYLIFIAGTLFELFGIEYGLVMSVVGGLFELFLSVWLMVKGFNTDAIVY